MAIQASEEREEAEMDASLHWEFEEVDKDPEGEKQDMDGNDSFEEIGTLSN